MVHNTCESVLQKINTLSAKGMDFSCLMCMAHGNRWAARRRHIPRQVHAVNVHVIISSLPAEPHNTGIVMVYLSLHPAID